MPNGVLTYRRGEIRWVTLDPTVGAEVQKTRSCLIVQNDVMNQYGSLTIVMPFRPGTKKAPYVVNIKATTNQDLRNWHSSRVRQMWKILEYVRNYWG